jgi:hypothetical protein
MLGHGVRLFEDLGDEPIDLEALEILNGPRATHLRYRVRERATSGLLRIRD